MVDKKTIMNSMKELSLALNKYHGNSETAKYVSESLTELQKNEEWLSQVHYNIS